MTRQEFPTKIKVAAWSRAKGFCEKCGAWLTVGTYRYDHVLPCALGGKPVLDNCEVLCVPCHKEKTGTQDVPQIRKADRAKARHLGAKTPKRPMAGSRASKWKRKVSGEVVER